VPSASEPQAEPAPRARRSRRGGERPPAPWGAFPLVELVILLALVLLGLGFFTHNGVMVVCGVGLAMLGGVEISIREHFAGYRSHTTLLSGVIAVIVMTFAFLAVPDQWPVFVPLGFGLVLFGASFYLLRQAFKRRS
jgi:hypothetical protein